MDQEHRIFQDNLSAYALGALDPDEVAALEAHLQTCESCRSDLAAQRRLANGLLAALPPKPPRASLRRSLQARVSGQTLRARPQPRWSWAQLALAGGLVLLLILNLVTASQIYALQREQAELIQRRAAEDTTIAMLAYPTTKTLTFDENGVSGSLLVDKQRNLLTVFAWNLAPLPAGKTYQMWLIDPQGDRTSGGFLAPEDGYPFVMGVIRSPQPLSHFTGFGITIEPAGGSTAPTGPRVVKVEF